MQDIEVTLVLLRAGSRTKVADGPIFRCHQRLLQALISEKHNYQLDDQIMVQETIERLIQCMSWTNITVHRCWI